MLQHEAVLFTSLQSTRSRTPYVPPLAQRKESSLTDVSKSNDSGKGGACGVHPDHGDNFVESVVKRRVMFERMSCAGGWNAELKLCLLPGGEGKLGKLEKAESDGGERGEASRSSSRCSLSPFLKAMSKDCHGGMSISGPKRGKGESSERLMRVRGPIDTVAGQKNKPQSSPSQTKVAERENRRQKARGTNR